MKQITYAGKSFVTGTDLADAVMRLTAALGLSSETAGVTIPAMDENGHITTADLVLGPATEVLAIAIESDQEEIVDENVVAQLDERTRQLEPTRTVASADPLPGAWSVNEL
jgi:hypothetical protein